jgi:hypothetical protein
MITVFLEYKVKPDTFQAYETAMEFVSNELHLFGATQFEWYRAIDQPSLYVECFKVQNKNEYETIKNMRISAEHRVYSRLDALVEGGLEKIHCWAFEQLNVKEDPQP